MSYECFEGLMKSLIKYWNHMCELESSLEITFEGNWMTEHFDRISDAITTEFEGPDVEDVDPNIGPIILYYIFDLECGEKGNRMRHKGIDYEINNLGDLYTVLKSIKDYRESGLD